ncbi:MAG TPA: ABC transporter permease subunit [Polyangiaceae bacterium]|nr:ABC transporter permease subunit [Polyangiaceae bacterium]
MIARLWALSYNTYREAVRARILHGLFALALGAGVYAQVVAAFSNRAKLRALSDLGAASVSIFAVFVAIVLGATSLYRELELKTIFPILSRPLERGEYLVGKFLGALLTLSVFIAANTGALLMALGQAAGRSFLGSFGGALGVLVAAAIVAWRMPRLRTALPIPVALILLGLGYLLAGGAPDDRRVLVFSAWLTLCEVGIVMGVTSVFSSFSSPFLTAVFSAGVFVVGRSAATLGELPVRQFGEQVRAIGQGLSRVLPNLMLYVPERRLLTGEAAMLPIERYLAYATLHAAAWAVGLLALAAVLFRRRDFL